jgi:hypothetical protein
MKNMKNVGATDKRIRYGVSVFFIILGVVSSPWFLIPAALLIFTASVSFCGLYRVFGINTCPVDLKDKDDSK